MTGISKNIARRPPAMQPRLQPAMHGHLPTPPTPICTPEPTPRIRMLIGPARRLARNLNHHPCPLAPNTMQATRRQDRATWPQQTPIRKPRPRLHPLMDPQQPKQPTKLYAIREPRPSLRKARTPSPGSPAHKAPHPRSTAQSRRVMRRPPKQQRLQQRRRPQQPNPKLPGPAWQTKTKTKTLTQIQTSHRPTFYPRLNLPRPQRKTRAATTRRRATQHQRASRPRQTPMACV